MCTSSGLYFFGVSAAVPAGVRTRVKIAFFGFGAVEILRRATTTNAVTTVAGEFLLECRVNYPVTVELVDGQVSPGPRPTLEESLLTFTAFQYNSSRTTANAWSVYRDSNWTVGASAIDPFAFDGSDVETVGSVTWSTTTHEATITVTGNYYVYVSGATQPNNALGLTVKLNGVGVFGVNHFATNSDGPNTMGHGVVLYLYAGDRLKVVAEPNTAGFSGSALRHASFFGFLII